MPGQHQEAGIVPGAQTIDLQQGSSRGALLLHGFGDTPQTLRLVAESLFAAGWDVRAPLLPGHGRNVAAFTASCSADWIAAARDELGRMQAGHPKVALCGLSMGGAIAATLAAETRDIVSLALIAPYVEMPFVTRLMARSHWLWGRAAGVRKSSNPRSIRNPEERAKNLGYGVYSARLLYELLRTANAGRGALPEIRCPTLLVQSREDPRISPAAARRSFAALRTPEKKLVWIEGAGHIVTVDYGREHVLEEVRAWLDAHVPNEAMTA